MNTTYLSLSEVAQELSLTRRDVRQLIARGLLAGYAFGRQVRINSRDLEVFVKKSKVNGKVI